MFISTSKSDFKPSNQVTQL